MSSGAWTRQRRFELPRLGPRRLLSLRTLLAIVVLALIAGATWLWYRDSSFVKVQRVTVTGVIGEDARPIREALTHAGLTMTTLDVQIQKLDGAVSRFGIVHSLTVDTEGDHALLIHVDERVPVARVYFGGESVVVDGEGLLLPASTVTTTELPSVPLASRPDNGQITDSHILGELIVLQAAPYRFLAHIQSATWDASHGVTLQLRNGPALYFGSDSQLAFKWSAAIAVLANSSSAGAAYIDVSDPQLPAAGVPSQTTTTATTNTSTDTTTSGSVVGSTVPAGNGTDSGAPTNGSGA